MVECPKHTRTKLRNVAALHIAFGIVSACDFVALVESGSSMFSKTKPLETMSIIFILFDGQQEAETPATLLMTNKTVNSSLRSTHTGTAQQVKACIS